MKMSIWGYVHVFSYKIKTTISNGLIKIQLFQNINVHVTPQRNKNKRIKINTI